MRSNAQGAGRRMRHGTARPVGALEQGLGLELRPAPYAGVTVLKERSVPAFVSNRVRSTRLDKHGARKKPLKRPAVATAIGIQQRHVAASISVEPAEDAAALDLVPFVNAFAIEDQVGASYRRGYANKFCGLDPRGIQHMLLDEGYGCSRSSWWERSRRYSRGARGQPAGNVATYALGATRHLSVAPRQESESAAATEPVQPGVRFWAARFGLVSLEHGACFSEIGDQRGCFIRGRCCGNQLRLGRLLRPRLLPPAQGPVVHCGAAPPPCPERGAPRVQRAILTSRACRSRGLHQQPGCCRSRCSRRSASSPRIEYLARCLYCLLSIRRHRAGCLGYGEGLRRR